MRVASAWCETSIMVGPVTSTQAVAATPSTARARQAKPRISDDVTAVRLPVIDVTSASLDDRHALGQAARRCRRPARPGCRRERAPGPRAPPRAGTNNAAICTRCFRVPVKFLGLLRLVPYRVLLLPKGVVAPCPRTRDLAPAQAAPRLRVAYGHPYMTEDQRADQQRNPVVQEGRLDPPCQRREIGEPHDQPSPDHDQDGSGQDARVELLPGIEFPCLASTPQQCGTHPPAVGRAESAQPPEVGAERT